MGWKVKRLALRSVGVGARVGEHRQADDRDLAPGRLQEGHRGEHADQEDEVLLPGDPEPPHLVEVALQVRPRLRRVGPAVPDDVDGQHEGGGEQPRHEQPERPGEGNAEQVAEEERGVAERRQAAPDVRDEEDEEDDGVGDVLALAVRLQEGPDEQHRGAGRPHEGGEDGPDAQERRVRPRGRLEVALEEDAAGDHEEAAQEHDERHVVLGGVDERPRVGPQVQDEDRRGQDDRDPELAEVRLPEVRRGQRQDGDRQEQPHERQRPGERGDEGLGVHAGRKSIPGPICSIGVGS